MQNYIYTIQACHLTGDIAYTVCANTVEQMQQEILDALNDGFIVQVGKIVPQENGGK